MLIRLTPSAPSLSQAFAISVMSVTFGDNLIIIGLGISLTINYGVGYSLMTPVLLYYLKKDIK